MIALAFLAVAGVAQPRLRELDLRELSGAPAALAPGRARVVMFWRSDCGPCLLELRDLAGLRRESPLPITPVALDRFAPKWVPVRRLESAPDPESRAFVVRQPESTWSEKALGAGPSARRALARLRLPARASLLARGDQAAILTRFGGPPPRLPLAVAFDAEGAVCARRTGLLGYDRLKAWARVCGGSGAARR